MRWWSVIALLAGCQTAEGQDGNDGGSASGLSWTEMTVPCGGENTVDFDIGTGGPPAIAQVTYCMDDGTCTRRHGLGWSYNDSSGILSTSNCTQSSETSVRLVYLD